MKKWKSVCVLGIASLLVLAGCKATATKETSTTKENVEHYPIKIKNFTSSDGAKKWQKKEVTFEASPHRVVANTQGTAEMLLHLGLESKIVGVAALYGGVDSTVKKEFESLPVLSKEYVGKELVLGATPDLVIGRAGLFANEDWGVGTVSSLNDAGVQTYVQRTSIPKAAYTDLYLDIKDLGKVFNVEKKATSWIKELKEKEQSLKQSVESVKKEKSYAYIWGVDGENVTIYSGADDTYITDTLSKIKLSNAFAKSTGEITKESLVAKNPDVLLIPYYDGGSNNQQTLAALYSNKALQTVNAIKNHQVFFIDYNEFWSYGYRILDGTEKLAKEIYPEQFKN